MPQPTEPTPAASATNTFSPEPTADVSRPILSAAEKDAYRTTLISKLNAAKRYPKRAQRRRIQGTVTVRFVIDRRGNVLSKELEQSSGADILDQAALSMLDRASPLPAPPPGYGEEPFSFRIPLSFRLR